MTIARKLIRTTPTEELLSIPRDKGRPGITAIGYRISRIGDALFGKQRMLRFFLNGSRLFWRFAFERSGAIYNSDFHNNAKALSEDYLRRWISSGDSVIDIGCGTGRWCRVCAKYAAHVVGIDHSEELIRNAHESTPAGTNIEYTVGDATTDLRGRKFNLGLLVHVLEHIDDPGRFLNGLRSVVNKLIVEVPDFESDPLNLIRLDMDCPFYSDADHVREYTQSILNDQLERNGWHVLENWKNGGAVLAVAERKPA